LAQSDEPTEKLYLQKLRSSFTPKHVIEEEGLPRHIFYIPNNQLETMSDTQLWRE